MIFLASPILLFVAATSPYGWRAANYVGNRTPGIAAGLATLFGYYTAELSLLALAIRLLKR